MKNFKNIIAVVEISSDLALGELAQVISEKVLGGAPFQHSDVFDEVPTCLCTIFGCSITLSENCEDAFEMAMIPQDLSSATSAEDEDISEYLAALLCINGVGATAAPRLRGGGH